MTRVSAETPIGAEVARLTKTATLSQSDKTPSDGGTHIHTDEYAQQVGFESALVPGITLLGYITEMLAGLFGEVWFERGSVSVRFRRPIYDKEPVLTKAILKERREENGVALLAVDLSLESTRDGRVAVVGEAACPLARPREAARS